MHGLRTACRTTAYRGRSPSAKYVAPRVQLARQPGYALDRDALLLRKALQQLHVVARREQRHPAGSARGAFIEMLDA